MANILDLQSLELRDEDVVALGSGNSAHCNDTSGISLFC
ncbi:MULTISPECIES: class III lanthipeptide [Streptomyces]|nr:class III lanthipeptide [Streptomyces sp. P9-2B-2]WJY39774.1 class III lanthipeptide [Streptomyces sp. P9-2B-2]WSW53640.1 class III lanthipeptide [Streptomyces platensis]